MDMNASSGIENAPDFPELPSYADGRGRPVRVWICACCGISWRWPMKATSPGRPSCCRSRRPTLSRQLKSLEDALGVTLFHRGPHQISLTPEGRLLRERARNWCSWRARWNARCASCTVRCPESSRSVARRHTAWIGWPGASREFRRRYPEVEFEMRTCTADVTGDRLEQGLADLGLVTETIGCEQIRLPAYAYR